MLRVNSEGIDDLCYSLLWSLVATLVIICVCWLFFDFRIIDCIRGWRCGYMRRITIIDDSGVESIEKKLLPLMRKYEFTMAVGVYPSTGMPDVAKKINNMNLQPIYTTPFYEKGEVETLKKKEPDFGFRKHRVELAKIGIEPYYMLYPCSGDCVNAMREFAKKNFTYAFVRGNSTPVCYTSIDDCSCIGITFIEDRRNDIDAQLFLNFAEKVKENYGWGILVIRSGYDSFGPKSIAALEEMIRYCRDNQIEICPVSKL